MLVVSTCCPRSDSTPSTLSCAKRALRRDLHSTDSAVEASPFEWTLRLLAFRVSLLRLAACGSRIGSPAPGRVRALDLEWIPRTPSIVCWGPAVLCRQSRGLEPRRIAPISCNLLEFG